ncbi:MAG: hypothetical protein ACLFPD_06845 [Desulfosudaceae bacterium]
MSKVVRFDCFYAINGSGGIQIKPEQNRFPSPLPEGCKAANTLTSGLLDGIKDK